MKFYFIALGIACLAIVSCKKERTCSCSISTSGTERTHAQTAGTTIPLPIPGIPPIVLVAAKDTTFDTPFSFSNSQKTNYEKVSKSAMKKNCPATVEETFTDQTAVITPGTSTITVLKSGKRTYTCKIE